MGRGFSWAHRVLLRVMRGYDPDDLLREAAPGDWPELARAATHHGLQGLLADALRGSGRVPEDFQVNLQAGAVRLMAQRENHLRSAAAAVDALATGDVVPVVLKGPALAERYYPNPAARPYGDVDLLVSPLELRRAIAAFEASGFEVGDRNWDLLVGDLRGQVHLLRANLSTIELHWHVVNGARQRRTIPVTWDALAAAGEPWELDGRACRALPPEVEIPSLCLHAALHGAGHALWLVDVGMIARRHRVDWDSVVRRLDEWRMRRAGLLILDLVRRWVHPDVPALGHPGGRRLSDRVVRNWDLGARADAGALRKLVIATGGSDPGTTIRLLRTTIVPPAGSTGESPGGAARRLSWETLRRISDKLRDERSDAPEFERGAGTATIETYLAAVEAATREGSAPAR
jgi:hypothetical protein